MSRRVFSHEGQETLFPTDERVPFSLRPYQREAVAAMLEALRENDRHPACIAATGAGKCLGKDTPILLYDGRVLPVQDVQVGDLLMGPDSQPRKVVSLARGREMLYRIVPIKGDSYVVNASHILSLKITGTGGKSVSGYQEYSIVNLSVQEYLKETPAFRQYAKGWRTGVEFTAQSISLPPYALGVWLGDGAAPEVGWNALAQASGMDICRGHCQDLRITSHRKKGHNQVLAALQSYGLIPDRHIPQAYLVNSREVRLELLAGLLDTGGYYNHGNYQLPVKSDRLAKDVLFLCRSLGFAAYSSRVVQSIKSSGCTVEYHSISISGNLDEIPCRIERQQAATGKQKKEVLVTDISVDPIGEGEYYGFEIAGPDRLFLLGDFTVTHNTVIMGSFIERYLREYPQENVLVLAHRAELITQAAERFSHVLPQDVIPAIHCASLKQKDFGQVTVASVQTIGKPDILRSMPAPGLIIVDEAHRIPLEGNGQYQRLIQTLKDRHHDLRVAGFTATPWRLDGGHIVGPGNPLNHIAYQIEPALLIKEGFLVPPQWATTQYPIETGKARSRKGDFLNSDLLSAAAIQHKERIQDLLTWTTDREHTIVFTIDRKHARKVAQDLPDSVVVDGDTSPEVRSQKIQDFRDGKYRYLVNVDLFIEGFDLPKIDAVAVLRPTQSAARWIQMVGRGLRTTDGKDDCLVLDYGGNLERFPMKPDEPGFFNHNMNGQGATTPGGTTTAPPATATVVLPPPFTYPVSRVDATVFHSNHKDRDFLTVRYFLGMSAVEQVWVVPSSDFKDFWSRHGYGKVPATPNEAMQRIREGDLLLPRAVSLRYRENPNKPFGYSEIVSEVHSWAETMKNRHTFYRVPGHDSCTALTFDSRSLIRPTPVYGQHQYQKLFEQKAAPESGAWITPFPLQPDSEPVHFEEPVFLMMNQTGMSYVAEKAELDRLMNPAPVLDFPKAVFSDTGLVRAFDGKPNLLAPHELGNLGYQCAQKGLYDMAEQWWKQAAEKGDAASRRNLGLLREWRQETDSPKPEPVAAPLALRR